MKIIAISDTHGKHEQLQIPDGDVLIHGGDICASGTLEELAEFDDWMGTLPHPSKIVIAGNHDGLFQNDPEAARATVTNYTYIQDETRWVVRRYHSLAEKRAAPRMVKFYGSPWTPPFQDWHFMAEPDEIAKKWAAIPQDTDVLITHGPPWGVGDRTLDGRQGCASLRDRVARICPALHVFGHIHEGYGMYGHRIAGTGGETTYINASVLNEHYQLVNDPVVIEI